MRWSSAAAVLLSAALLLSGCIGGSDDGGGVPGGTLVLPDVSTLSQKVFGILPPVEVWVTASDAVVGETGTRLNNAVYLPDVPAGTKVPVFINFSPYWADTAMTEGDHFSQYMIHEYVPRGYAVVLSAVRGTGHSEGCFEVASDRESQDVNEVVDFFANEPWSNGRIAAGGKSYDSTTQNGMIAKYPHPALKGIFHVSGITDMYSYTFQNGVPARSDSASFTTSYGVGQSLGEYGLPPPPLGTGGGSPEDEGPDSLVRLVGDGCAATPLGASNAGASTAAGAKTAYWNERDWTQHIGGSDWNGSIFFVHGLQDWNVQPSHILPWIDRVNANGDIKVLGWLHQWEDEDFEGNETTQTGHVYPMRTDWNETMLRWMDAILKGKDTGLDRLYGYDVEGTDLKWRHFDSWPPTAGLDFADVADNASFVVGGGPIHVSGAAGLDVTATSLTADPVITAVLYDEADGERTWVGEALLRGVFRESLETPTPVTPGMPVTYHLETYPFDHVFETGHKLVIDFGAAPANGQVVLPSQTQGVTYGTATLHLPTGGLGLVEPQPVWMQCFAC